MKRKNMKNLYTLIGKTALGAMKVEPSHDEPFASVKEVAKVEECNKIIKTLFSTKSSHWHKDETNCKKYEVMKNTRIVSRVKFNEGLNLIHVYFH